MTLKEQILKYADIIIEDVSPAQLGVYIQRELKRKTPNSEIFKILDNIGGDKWFHVQKNDTNKIITVILSPLSDNKTQKIQDLVASNVQNKEKVIEVFEKWYGTKMQQIKNKYNGYKIFSYNRKGELIKLTS